MPESKDLVLFEKTADGVAIITLNKPERMNAWSTADGFGEAWFDAYDRAEADPDVRVIVITGNGRGWCAGADMELLSQLSDGKVQVMSEPPTDDTLDALRAESRLYVDAKGRQITHVQSLSKPVIAAINGAVAGGGFGQMMACDIRFAADSARFSAAFSRRGLIAEWGISHTLPRAIGTGNAMDVLLSSRKFGAAEAKELGIVQKVFPKEDLLREAVLYATDMAVNVPPSSLAVIKRQVLSHPHIDHDTALQQSNQLMILSTLEAPLKEGVAAFIEKREPKHAAADRGSRLLATARRILAKL